MPQQVQAPEPPPGSPEAAMLEQMRQTQARRASDRQLSDQPTQTNQSGSVPPPTSIWSIKGMAPPGTAPEDMTPGQLAWHNASQIPSAIANFIPDAISGMASMAAHALTGNAQKSAQDVWGMLQPERTALRGVGAGLAPNMINPPSSKDWENAVYGATQQAIPYVAGGIAKAGAAAPGMVTDAITGRIGKALGKVIDATKSNAAAPEPPPSAAPATTGKPTFTHVTVRDATTGKFRSLTPAEEARFGVGKNATPAVPAPPAKPFATKGSVAASYPAAGTKKQEP